jgi:hypothetical protein
VHANFELFWGPFSKLAGSGASLDLVEKIINKISNRVRFLTTSNSRHRRQDSGEWFYEQRFHLLPKFPGLKCVYTSGTLNAYDSAEFLYECCPDALQHLTVSVINPSQYDHPPPSYIERHGHSAENVLSRIVKRVISFSKLTVRPPHPPVLFHASRSFAHLPGASSFVQSLHVSYSNTSDAIKILQGLPQLTSIRLEKNDQKNPSPAPEDVSQLHYELFNHPNIQIVHADLGDKLPDLTFDAPKWTSFSGGCQAGSIRFNCPNLVTLSISTFGSYLHLNTPKLLHLHLVTTTIKLISSGDREGAFSFPSTMIDFKLVNAKNISSSVDKYGSILEAVRSDCQDICAIALQYCGMPNEIHVPNFPTLEHLNLSYSIESTKIIFDGTDSQPLFPKLVSLDVSVCSKLLAIEISPPPASPKAVIFPSVRQLLLSSCWRGDIQNFAAFARRMPRLYKIEAEELPDKEFKQALFGDNKPTIHISGTTWYEKWAEKRKNDPFLNKLQKV